MLQHNGKLLNIKIIVSIKLTVLQNIYVPLDIKMVETIAYKVQLFMVCTHENIDTWIILRHASDSVTPLLPHRCPAPSD